jgi:phosphoribosylaminoimidazolecarboxamide formyltransferase/IMP cyclohydrolase
MTEKNKGKKKLSTTKKSQGKKPPSKMQIPKGKKVALISVYDKTGIVEFAQRLTKLGYFILSSGGTAKKISEAGVPVTDIAKLVGGEAILGHRVVTLSRELHAGLLAKFALADQKEMKKLGLPYIHLVCCDFYPLNQEIAKQEATINSVVEMTDIGGPTMVRSAAKGGRIVICDPADRDEVLQRLEQNKTLSEEEIQILRAKAEYIVSKYCLDSARFHSKGTITGLIGGFFSKCKYGENAWQNDDNTGLYSIDSNDPLALENFQLLTGMDPSFINYTDIDRLLQTITHIAAGFDVNFRGRVPLIAVAVKHGNPCGAAVGYDPNEVIKKMVLGDHLAVFGGIVMTNFPLTAEMVETLLTINQPPDKRLLLDGVIAPHVTDDAIELLRRKGDKCRILTNKHLLNLNQHSLDTTERIRPVRGGFLCQPNYTYVLDLSDKNMIITLPNNHNGLTKLDMEDIILAWAIGSTSNSNTTCLAREGQLLGDGVGQQSRVASCQVAVFRTKEAGHQTGATVAYTDSFCPQPDAPEVLANAGVSILFASSGSVNDQLVQKTCKEKGLILVQLPDSACRGFFGH